MHGLCTMVRVCRCIYFEEVKHPDQNMYIRKERYFPMKILIVGAGIGGLALAAHLQRDGHEITIVEKAEGVNHVDYIMTLWSNSRNALAPFNVHEHLEGIGLPLEREVIRDQTGAILTTLDYRSLTASYGPVLLPFHSDLHSLLREMTASIPIHFGTTLCTLKHEQQGVSVSLSDGTQMQFDLVVGADGTHSGVRKLLFGQGGISYSGLTLWLSVMPRGEQSLAEPTDLFGKGKYVGLFPSSTGKVSTLFLASAPAGHTVLAEQRIAHLREQFGSFGWMVPDVLHSMHDPATVFQEDIHQVSLETWYQGRVVLLGDAAHAVSPTAAMGAAMALEDAFVLSEELRGGRGTHVEAALAAYVSRRKLRMEKIQQTANFLLWVASIKHAPMVLLRNTGMRFLPPAFLLRDMKEILDSPM
jgi:FAD-dependent urate hydroxylase